MPRPNIFLPNSNYVPDEKDFQVVNASSFKPYTNQKYLEKLKMAMTLIETRYIPNPACNQAYAKEAKGVYGPRTLQGLWSDDGVWIGFDPSKGSTLGWTSRAGGYHIGITESAFQYDVDRIVAVILHEQAHRHGWGSNTNAPEAIVCACGLKCNLKYIG